MGSFQQISVGAICLGGAFWLGHYLNNNPHPEELETGAALADNRLAFESKGSLLDISAKPSPNSNFSAMPQAASSERSLPPPSQLEGSANPSTAQVWGQASETNNRNDLFADQMAASNGNQSSPVRTNASTSSDSQREIMLPDFSELAASFRNTPLELPPMNSQQEQRKNPVEKPFDPFPNVDSNSYTANNSPRPASNVEPIASPITPIAQLPIRDEAAVLPNQPEPQSIALPERRSGVEATHYAPNSVVSLHDRWSANFPDVAARVSGGSPSSGDIAAARLSDERFANGSSDQHSVMDASSNDSLIMDRQPGPQRQSDGWATRDRRAVETQFAPATENEVNSQVAPSESVRNFRPLVPFTISDEERNNLVRLRQTGERQLKLGATKFVDHLTADGETLQNLSTKYFGKPDFYLDIYLANRDQLRNPATVPAGVTLKIPVYE